jgi:predicted amidohydrolase YtcJ
MFVLAPLVPGSARSFPLRVGKRAVSDAPLVRVPGPDVRAYRAIELAGRTLVPGFNDAHNHMVAFGMSLAEVRLKSPPVTRLGDIYDRIAIWARETPPGNAPAPAR